MGLGGWVYDLYVDSYEKLDKMSGEIPKLASLHNLPFFFNRYSAGPDTTGPHFIRFGVLTAEKEHLKELFEKTRVVIDKAVEMFGAEVKRGLPDFRNIDGILVDLIKIKSTKVALSFRKKPTKPQIYLFIHFLMNQLGFNYKDEVDVYGRLIENIAKKCGIKATINLEEIEK